jgi:hypothetical protein
MEVNNLNNKLEYIQSLNKSSSNNLINHKEKLKVIDTDLDFEKNQKLIEECINYNMNKLKSSKAEKNFNLQKLELLNTKLKIFKGYFCLVLFTISLKHVDIVIRVKHGGNIILEPYF